MVGNEIATNPYDSTTLTERTESAHIEAAPDPGAYASKPNPHPGQIREPAAYWLPQLGHLSRALRRRRKTQYQSAHVPIQNGTAARNTLPAVLLPVTRR